MPNPTGADRARPEQLVHYGWTDEIALRYQPFAAPGRTPGRLVRIDRTSYQAITAEGIVTCQSPTGSLTGASEPLPAAAGDWVALRREAGFGHVVVAILPRHTSVTRHSAREERDQIVAANADRIAIVHGLDRPLRQARLERFLIVAWESGATPTVVLSKLDLVDADTVDTMSRGVSATAPGVAVVPVSNTTGEGIAELRAGIDPACSVALLGESGTGKSTLVNALAGEPRMATGPTRLGDGKGRHTTTTREVIPIGDGAVVIDTPGLRSAGLWAGDEGIALTFRDVESLAAACRFRDCRHDAEPGCAVGAAVRSGDLDLRRVKSYRKLVRELEQVAHRKEVRERRSHDGNRTRRRRPAPEADEW